MTLSPQDQAKQRAAARALEFVTPGMRLGLGTGSTAAFFVDLLGARVREGLKIVGVPTSEATRRQAEGLNIPLSTLEETPELDIVIDGADEFDAQKRLIKGGGGALLREKIVASAASEMIVIADSTKEVAKLGAFPLPVEVDRFGMESTRRHILRALEECGLSAEPKLRLRDGHVFVTDGGHAIYDLSLGKIAQPEALGARLTLIPGVVEHGLFLGLATRIVVADAAGTREIV
jgi:ribose 5-phosphate isomerase A